MRRAQFRFNYNYGTETIRSTQPGTVLYIYFFFFFGCNWTCGQGHVHGEALPMGVYTTSTAQTLGNFLSIYIKFTATKYRKGGKNIKNRLEGSWLDAANERHKRPFERVSLCVCVCDCEGGVASVCVCGWARAQWFATRLPNVCRLVSQSVSHSMGSPLWRAGPQECDLGTNARTLAALWPVLVELRSKPLHKLATLMWNLCRLWRALFFLWHCKVLNRAKTFSNYKLKMFPLVSVGLEVMWQFVELDCGFPIELNF